MGPEVNNTAGTPFDKPIIPNWPPSQISEVGDRKTRIAWDTLIRITANTLAVPEEQIGIDRVSDHNAPPKDLEKDYLDPRDITLAWRAKSGKVIGLARVCLHESRNSSNKEELVPVVYPIPGIDDLGNRVKLAVDRDTERRFGMSADNAIQGFSGYIRHKFSENESTLRKLAISLLGLSIASGGVFGIVKGYQLFDRKLDDAAKTWMDERPARLEEINRSIKIAVDNISGRNVVKYFLENFDSKREEDVKLLFLSGETHEKRLEGLKMIQEIRKLNQSWEDGRGWGDNHYQKFSDTEFRNLLLTAAKDGANGPIMSDISAALKTIPK